MSEEVTNSAPEGVEDETSLPESAEQSETQETVETIEAESEEDKPRKPTAKDRIDELTRLRREAERDAEYWKAKALQPAQEPKPAPQPAATKPDPEKYEAGEFDPKYIEDLTDWKAEQVVDRKLGQLEQRNRQQDSERSWQSRVEKASETMPDFEEKVLVGGQRGDWVCTSEMADALRASDKGPEIAYHLASDPAEASRIARLSPALQLMELGKLEAKLTQPKPKTVTNAPEPAPQARGSGGKFQVNPDTDDFAAFDKTYGNG